MKALKTFDRNYYKKIAEELCYPQSVIEKIKNASTDIECERILSRAGQEACKV